MKPQIGQQLWSSCAGESYGEIVAVGGAENGTPTIDIKTKINNIVCIEDDSEYLADVEWPNLVLSRVEPNIEVILRHLQYRMSNEFIICNTPGNECYRCTKLFSLK